MLEEIVLLLERYRYIVLFPLAIVEGPIISVISGFLCTTRMMHTYYALPVIVFGDITGDSFYYCLGRWRSNRPLPRLLRFVRPKDSKLERVRGFFESNPIRTISLSKIFLGVGLAGLFLAGNAKVPYRKFLAICLVTSIVQCGVYLSIGLLFGRAYIKIGGYLNGLTTFFIMLAIAALLFFSISTFLKKRK